MNLSNTSICAFLHFAPHFASFVLERHLRCSVPPRCSVANRSNFMPLEWSVTAPPSVAVEHRSGLLPGCSEGKPSVAGKSSSTAKATKDASRLAVGAAEAAVADDAAAKGPLEPKEAKEVLGRKAVKTAEAVRETAIDLPIRFKFSAAGFYRQWLQLKDVNVQNEVRSPPARVCWAVVAAGPYLPRVGKHSGKNLAHMLLAP